MQVGGRERLIERMARCLIGAIDFGWRHQLMFWLGVRIVPPSDCPQVLLMVASWQSAVSSLADP